MKAHKDAQRRSALKNSTVSGGAAKKRSSSSSSAVAAAGGKKGGKGGKASSSSAEEEGVKFQPIRDVIDAGKIVRELGDHIDTRFVDHDDMGDLDAGLGLNHDEEGQALIDEARMAAGDRRQAVMAEVRTHLFGKGYPFSSAYAAGGLTDATLSHMTPHQTCPPNMDAKTAFIGHNRNTVTCCAVLDMTVFYGDKTGHVFRAEPNATFSRSAAAAQTAALTSSSQQEYFYHRIPMNPKHKGAVLSLAISDTRGNRPANWGKERSSVDMSVLNYLVSGGQDGAIHVWKAIAGDYVGILKMHRAPVTGLAFRQWSSMLVSSSADTTIRLWSVPEMHCEDKFFGHNGPVNGVSSLRKERCATAGADRTVRHWKLDTATQVEFSCDGSAAECVAMVDDVHIVAGTSDGRLVLFDTNKRYPLQTIAQPHGSGFVGDGTGLEMLEGSPSPIAARRGNAITAIAALPYGDMVATGSYSGVIALWHFAGSAATNMNAAARGGNREKDAAQAVRPTNRLSLVATFTAKGCVNTLQFSPNGSVLIAAVGKDQRQGRWLTVSSALNGVMVIPLHKKGEEEVSGVTATTQVSASTAASNATSFPRRMLDALVQDPAHQPLTEEARAEARKKKRKELLAKRKAAREAAAAAKKAADGEDDDEGSEDEGDAIDNWDESEAAPAKKKAVVETKKGKKAVPAPAAVAPTVVPEADASDDDADSFSDEESLGGDAPAFKLGKDGQFVFDGTDGDDGAEDDAEDEIVSSLKKSAGAASSGVKKGGKKTIGGGAKGKKVASSRDSGAAKKPMKKVGGKKK